MHRSRMAEKRRRLRRDPTGGIAAREVEPAQERSHPQGCGRSLEARPLCTMAELWQDQRKAMARSRDGESRAAAALRQECGAGTNRNRRVGRRVAGILKL